MIMDDDHGNQAFEDIPALPVVKRCHWCQDNELGCVHCYYDVEHEEDEDCSC